MTQYLHKVVEMSSQSNSQFASLRSALEALSADLAAPNFLRTTLSAEQLREVLRFRERDLSAAVGLARLLVGKDEERDQEMQQIAIDKDALAAAVVNLRQENTILHVLTT